MELSSFSFKFDLLHSAGTPDRIFFSPPSPVLATNESVDLVFGLTGFVQNDKYKSDNWPVASGWAKAAQFTPAAGGED